MSKETKETEKVTNERREPKVEVTPIDHSKPGNPTLPPVKQ